MVLEQKFPLILEIPNWESSESVEVKSGVFSLDKSIT